MVIGGTVQSKGAGHPAGEVAMATDWIWSRSSSNGPNGASLANHPKGANVLYGSGTAKWVNYSAMIPVGTGGMIVPPGTYGFVKSGVGGTEIYDPEGSTISSNTGGDRKPGAGIMW